VKQTGDTISNFEGIVLNVHKARLQSSSFQTDNNGDRSDRGSWKVRRGLVHADPAKEGAAISFVHGFVANDGSYVFIHGNGGDVEGVADPTATALAS